MTLSIRARSRAAWLTAALLSVPIALSPVLVQPAAAQWIANARRYGGVQRSLDLIETTALLDPDKVRTGTGQSVVQPSPAGPSPRPAAVDDPTI